MQHLTFVVLEVCLATRGRAIHNGTAHFALTHRGHLAAGETLLVLGAAGGVGLAAIEVGKLLGARVLAAASTAEKLAIARQHGADETINYGVENLRDQVRALTAGKGVDVVFDPVGGGAFEQSVRCVGWEGRILVVGFASGDVPHVAASMRHLWADVGIATRGLRAVNALVSGLRIADHIAARSDGNSETKGH